MTSNIFNQQETSNMFTVGLNSELELTLIKEVLLFICSKAKQVSVTTLRQLYAQMWVAMVDVWQAKIDKETKNLKE